MGFAVPSYIEHRFSMHLCEVGQCQHGNTNWHQSATLIDNIYHNQPPLECNYICGILYTDLSDHFPIFYIKDKTNLLSSDEYFTIRKINPTTKAMFISKLEETNWDAIYTFNDSQLAYDVFLKTFLKIYNECFPKITVKNGYKNRKAWLSQCLKDAIKKKNKLYKLSKQIPTLSRENEYKEYRNLLKKLLKNAEVKHYQDLFEKYNNNLRKSWQVIRQLINRHSQRLPQTRFKHNDSHISDPSLVAHYFNEFFVNIGRSTAAKIPHKDKNPLSYLKGNYVHSFYATPVTEDEINIILKDLSDSACGWDEIDSKIVKATRHTILQPIVHICNLSLANGIFPQQLKIAKVIPLYKGSDASLFSNYRPISVLPVFSKVLERVMYVRLIEYLNTNKILYSFQFGFRKNHSAAMALILLVDRISKALENGDFVIGLFLDFSKAFDTINYHILFAKLHHYGIRGCLLDWFKSYLTDRKQYVYYNGYSSSTQTVTCGVPQGSILGPLLFLIYVNDLATVSEHIFSILFADDTNMFMCGKNVQLLEEKFNAEMGKVFEWIQINKLSLNIKKTQFMFFHGRRYVDYVPNILINDCPVSKTDCIKFLGIMVDQHLSWRDHINYISKKVSKSVGILHKIQNYLDKKTLKSLYYSLIYPYLIYCNEVWGLAYASHRNRLFLLQKRAVRLICHSPSKILHTDPLFIDLGILKLNNINHYVLQLFMFRFHTRKLPVIFDDMFTRNVDIHSHGTRQKLHLHVPLPKTNLVKMSVCYTGVTRWNYYTKFIDTYCSLDVYKKRLKMYLHKHQWKCRVSTMFIHLILITLLITNGCNITVYLLYLSLQPVYPI